MPWAIQAANLIKFERIRKSFDRILPKGWGRGESFDEFILE